MSSESQTSVNFNLKEGNQLWGSPARRVGGMPANKELTFDFFKTLNDFKQILLDTNQSNFEKLVLRP